MIILERGVTVSQIVGEFPWSKVRNIVSYEVKNHHFMAASRQGWDGKISFLTKTGRFPSGLTDRMSEGMTKLNLEHRVQYTYTLPPIYAKRNIPVKLDGMTARRYQLEATWNAVNHRQGIIKLPTGAGKTVIALLIVKTLQQPTLFITHRSEIMHQTYKRFVTEFGEDAVGMVGDGIRMTGRLITIGMIPTLVKFKKDDLHRLFKVNVLIGDEIHHAPAKTWKQTIKKCTALYRIGLTATPGDAGEQMELEAATGKVVYEAKVDALAKQGYLTKPHAILMSRVNTPEISDRFDYQQAFKLGIIENHRRNTRIVSITKRLVQKGLGPVLIFSTRKGHLRRLIELTSARNLNYEILTGADKTPERQRVIDKLKANKVDILFVSTIFDEGVDIPNIGSVVMAAVGKAKKKVIQRIGRGMRVAEGKDKFIVVDFFDSTCKYLLNHSKRRRAIYKREGYDVVVGSVKKYLETL